MTAQSHHEAVGEEIMPDRIAGLETRIERIEDAVTAGLDGVKDFIKQEIQELKTEQLHDIKSSIDRVERDSKAAHDRLADDQRRAWDAIRALEADRFRRQGGAGAMKALWTSLTAVIGGGVGAFIAWLLHRP